jgi:hypothetical protein
MVTDNNNLHLKDTKWDKETIVIRAIPCVGSKNGTFAIEKKNKTKGAVSTGFERGHAPGPGGCRAKCLLTVGAPHTLS